MKQLRLLFATIVLALALGIPAYAGDMGFPTSPPPPPPPPPSAPSVQGETADSAVAAPAPGDVQTPTETVLLNLLLSALAIL
jgi:hypothetical protein